MHRHQNKVITHFLRYTLILLLLLSSIEVSAQFWKRKEQVVARPRISFSVAPTQVLMGDSVLVKWRVTYSGSIDTLVLNDEKIEPEGSQWVMVTQSQPFNLRVVTETGEVVKRQRSVNVRSPDILRFEIPPAGIYGGTIEASWVVNNAHRVYLNDEEVPSVHKMTLSIMSDTSFVLRAATKSGHSIEQNIDVQCNYTYNIGAFIGHKFYNQEEEMLFYPKQKVRLRWQLDDVSNIFMNGTPIDEDNGIMEVNAKTDTVFVFRFTTAHHKDTSMHMAMRVKTPDLRKFYLENVKSGKQPNYFRASFAEEVLEGRPYYLNWFAEGVDTVYVDGEPYPASHSLKLVATQEKRHVLHYFYYNGKGDYVRNTVTHNLVFQKRPHFHNNIREVGSLAGEEIFMDIFGVDLTEMPSKFKLKVVAVDEKGDFISGLANPGQEKVFLNVVEAYQGQKTLIKDLRVREVHHKDTLPPRDIIMVVDNSGSMGYVYKYMDKIVERFVRNKRDEDRISFVKFDHRLVFDSPFMYSVDSIMAEYNRVPFDSLSGMTALYAATDLGMLKLNSHSQGRDQKLILFADGEENASFIYFEDLYFTAYDVLRRARHLQIPLSVVSLGSWVNFSALQSLADYSFGHYYPITRVSDIDHVFKEITNTQTTYYEVSYRPYSLYKDFTEIILSYKSTPDKERTVSKQLYGSDNIRGLQIVDPITLPPNLLKDLRLLNYSPVAAAQNVANFDFDYFTIRDEDMETLLKYINYLENNPTHHAILVGYTDLRGSDEYCYTLSENRANEIRDFLVEKGIDTDRLHAVGLGKENPVWPVSTKPIHDFENRRVEIILLKPR